MAVRQKKTGCSQQVVPRTRAKRVFTAVIATHQIPLLEYDFDDGQCVPIWRLYLSYDKHRRVGTRLVLYADGMITRETIDGTGGPRSVGIIKPGEPQ